MIVRLLSVSGGLEKTGSLEIIPENCPLDPAGRLSISLDDQNLSSGPSSCGSPPGLGGGPLGTPGASQTLPGRLTASAQAAQFGRRGGQHQQPEMMSYTCLPQVRQPNRALMQQPAFGSCLVLNSWMFCKPKAGGGDN